MITEFITAMNNQATFLIGLMAEVVPENQLPTTSGTWVRQHHIQAEPINLEINAGGAKRYRGTVIYDVISKSGSGPSTEVADLLILGFNGFQVTASGIPFQVLNSSIGIPPITDSNITPRGHVTRVLVRYQTFF